MNFSKTVAFVKAGKEKCPARKRCYFTKSPGLSILFFEEKQDRV
jgi:hypothetical protein